jgi:predicted dehydrogenase
MGQLYARTLATQVSGVHLYAVANLDEHARKQVAEEFGVSHVFADAYELIALPELDAVVIATPTNTHHDLVIAAADAGKAIFCEKPMRSPPARLVLPPLYVNCTEDRSNRSWQDGPVVKNAVRL